MLQIRTSEQFTWAIVSWCIAAIVGIGLAAFIVGFLKLWVLVGAMVGLGGTIGTGVFLQILLCTDVDALLAERKAEAELSAARRTDVTLRGQDRAA